MSNASSYAALRVASIAVVAATALSTRHIPGLWLSVVLSVGFGHYALSVLYAKEPIRRVLSRPRSIASFAILAAGSYLLYTHNFSLLIAFAVHHVFNEVYLPDRVLKTGDALRLKQLRFARTALNFFIFFVLVRHAPEIQNWSRPLLFGGLLCSAVMVAALMFHLRQNAPRAAFIDLCAFELIGLLIVVLSFFYNVRFLEIVLYHFVFWALYPLPKMLERGTNPAVRYVGLNVLLSAGFLLLSPVSPLVTVFSDAQWFAQFRFWSYFHIATAFALSTAFPDWITRWFKPAPAPAVAT